MFLFNFRLRCALVLAGLAAFPAAATQAAESSPAASPPPSTVPRSRSVTQAPQEIPVACDADVVVVGGSSGAVAAACEAAQRGANVFLLAERPYLGTDLCATLRLWLEPGEQPASPLAVACFGQQRSTTPLRVKAEMDKALLRAGVRFLTGCYVTDVLREHDGRLAGIVMANRSGRQAVRAKVIVDATSRATVARLAGAEFRPFVPGPLTFQRVVIGGEVRSGEHLKVEQKDFTYESGIPKAHERLPVYEYTLQIEMPSNDADSFTAAEHRARDMTYAAGSESASEVLSYVPADTVVGKARTDTWPGAEQADVASFQPRGMSRLYVLSAYADLGTEATQRLQRPLEMIGTGARIGRAAADEAAALVFPAGAGLPETAVEGGIVLAVGETLAGTRLAEPETIRSGRRALPILGRYDVVVVGGGTSGAPAGIAAAKSGAKTLVIEYLYELGGVGTVGLIGEYWYGRRKGYTEYVDQQVNPGKSSWSAVAKAEWLRRELTKGGADVWLGAFGCGALTEGGQVRGVVVATPWGRGAVLASTVIDATGNADVAAWAGAQTQFGITETGSLNVQIAGFPERPLQRSYVNTCYTLVDDTDVLDVWHLMVWRRTTTRNPAAFDVGQLVDSRERRRVVGDYTLTVPDILNQRTFPDTISQHYSNFDAAAFPDSRVLLARDAKGPCFHADLPYRCLLSKGLDGILVVGLGASAERDAMTLIRMQPDLQNQGYAAGLAAVAAVSTGGRTREIDVRALQQELVRQGILDERVLTDKDSYPADDEELERAVQAIGGADDLGALRALANVVAHRDQAVPLLKTAFRQSPAGDQQQTYARILGILGDPTGAPVLIAAINAYESWDQGLALTSQRKTGNTFSQLDRLVIALGFTQAPQAAEALRRKLEQLKPDSELSHYKAISMAMRNYCGPAAAEPLARLLNQPGFTGHAAIQPVVRRETPNGEEFAAVADRFITADGDRPANSTNLNRAYRELIVAAMLHRCGDRDGIAQAVLQQYATDLHGHFASYARRTLDGDRFGPPRK